MKNIFLLILSLFILSCSEKKNKYAVDEKSEMAQLMVDMHANLLEVQEKIKANEKLEPKIHDEILTATFTAEHFDAEGFEGYAKSLIEAEKALYDENQTDKKTAYQNVVNSCVACHSTIACRGPLPKIKKLRWKEK